MTKFDPRQQVRDELAREPDNADAVRRAIATLSPLADDATNDLDRLSEDLDLGPVDRLRLAQLLEHGLGHSVNPQLVLRAVTVADLMQALH